MKPPAGPLPAASRVRIVRSQTMRGGGRLPHTIGNARSVWQAREGLLLLIWDSQGKIGIGEASPLPGFSTETLADCTAALKDIHLRISSWDPDGFPIVGGLDAVPAARFAWECAVADLMGKVRGCSVSEVLGGKRQYAAVPLSALVGSVEEGRAALSRGIAALKVKVGGRAEAAQLALVRQLRSELGNQFSLRLDANGSWRLDEARARMEELSALGPEFIEQPTRPGELVALGACAVPWAADESLSSPAEVRALLTARGCVAWVLKPAALGLRRARELALMAQHSGLGVVITHLFDGPIGLAAACELSLSLPRAPWACGLDAHVGLSAWPQAELPHHRPHSGAEIRAHSRHGLGFLWEGMPWS